MNQLFAGSAALVLALVLWGAGRRFNLQPNQSEDKGFRQEKGFNHPTLVIAEGAEETKKYSFNSTETTGWMKKAISVSGRCPPIRTSPETPACGPASGSAIPTVSMSGEPSTATATRSSRPLFPTTHLPRMPTETGSGRPSGWTWTTPSAYSLTAAR